MQDKKQTQQKKTKTNETGKHTKKQKHKQETKPKTSTAGGQLVSSWTMENARRHDNIVSPQGLVWQWKTKAEQQTTECEPGSNRYTMRKPRLPPATFSQSASRHGQHSHRLMDTIQEPARRCLVASGKKTLKGEKRS